MGDWTFFSNYGHVLVSLARNGNARLRDVAADVGITERAVQKIVKDLQEEGYIAIRKQGRCNRYRVNRRKTLRHALESQCTIGRLLALVTAGRVPTIAEPEQVLAEAEPVPQAAVEAPRAPAPEPAPVASETPRETSGNTPGPAGEAHPEPPSRADRKNESEPTSAPLDVEQQGSLF